jgi:hypothetical protein
MQLVDAGINAISSAVGGLGGNAVGAAGSGVNNFINDISSTFRR